MAERLGFDPQEALAALGRRFERGARVRGPTLGHFAALGPEVRHHSRDLRDVPHASGEGFGVPDLTVDPGEAPAVVVAAGAVELAAHEIESRRDRVAEVLSRTPRSGWVRIRRLGVREVRPRRGRSACSIGPTPRLRKSRMLAHTDLAYRERAGGGASRHGVVLSPMRAFLFSLSFCATVAACASTSPSESPAYQHRFEHAEHWSQEFDDPSRDAWQKPELVVSAMKIAPGMTVADIGAGTGYFEAHLSRAVGPGGRVLALDIEPDMVRYLTDRAAREQLANVEARQVAPDDPGLPAASIDRVLIVDTWHHISNRAAYASRLAVALKPGGEVVVVDFRRDADRGPPPEHRIAPEEVARELAAGGLAARVTDAGLPEQYVVVGTRP